VLLVLLDGFLPVLLASAAEAHFLWGAEREEAQLTHCLDVFKRLDAFAARSISVARRLFLPAALTRLPGARFHSFQKNASAAWNLRVMTSGLRFACSFPVVGSGCAVTAFCNFIDN
jgi:hypothetical protein